MDKISIITTFYNAERFIEKALMSIASQEVDSKKFGYEYIIVDDKSPDNSRTIVENFIKKYNINNLSPNIQWKIVEPKHNLGCGGARRFGIQNATGDYFMFLDADDYYINKDFIRRAYTTITSENADIVEYGVLYNQPDGRQQNNTSPQKIIIDHNKRLSQIAIFKDNLIKFNVWSKIYKRWVVESYEYSDERTFEDVRTIPNWVYNANKIVVMTTPEINYRAASDSIIRTDWNKTRLGTISAIASHFEKFKDDPEILKVMYMRAMIDLEAVLNNHSSENEGFNEMSKLNTYMLKFIYPDSWKNKTYNI